MMQYKATVNATINLGLQKSKSSASLEILEFYLDKLEEGWKERMEGRDGRKGWKIMEGKDRKGWKMVEKISWTDHVRNEEVLLRVNEQRNILHEISKRKANWIGHILRRNCLLQQVIEGKIKGGIEVTGRRGRRSRKLLDDLKERKGYSHLKEEALDHTLWRAHFGRGFGPVARQTTK
jgi:hypothetical protein